jgi:hypothetical protein
MLLHRSWYSVWMLTLKWKLRLATSFQRCWYCQMLMAWLDYLIISRTLVYAVTGYNWRWDQGGNLLTRIVSEFWLGTFLIRRPSFRADAHEDHETQNCVHAEMITYPISPRGSRAPGHRAPGTPPVCSQLQCRKLHRFTQLRIRPTVIGRKEQCRCVTGDAQGRGGGGVRGALEGDREPARRLRHPAPLHRPVDQLKRRRETNCEEEGRGTGRGG